MTTTNNTVRFQTPAWADPELTQIEHEEGEPDAVRFAASIDGVEFNQWCDEKEGELTVTDGPYVTTHRLPDLDDLPMSEVAQLGATLIRISQYVALAEGTATEIGALKLSDVSRIARRQNTTATALIRAVGRRGAEQVAS
ncbi:hypothetical protein HR12_23525 [Microbacterium sp. SUBG005]|nr:hypothetical protein HR12_23525 [Microbacterium sp. SUBG005]